MAIITLSRGTYSGAKVLAKHIAQSLDYRLLSRETIVNELAQYGWADEKLSKAHHKKLSMLQRMNLEWVHYQACLRAVLSEAAQTENLVYHGNNGHIVLQDFPHLLNIKVVADMEDRIKAVTARNEYAIDRKEAIRIVKRIDERRDRWSNFLYQADMNDISSFDMVIDLSRKSLEDAYEMIRSAVSLPQFQPTQESKKIIEDLTLAARLRARIAMETDVVDDEIEVEINDGMLNVKGGVHSLEDAEELKQFLSLQPEITHLESHLENSPSGMGDV
jgi:cytidylate kinase